MSSGEYGDRRAEQIATVVSAALGEWMASNGGGFVTAFALVVDYVDEDGDRGWATAHAENQMPATTLGMLRFHTLNVEQQVLDYFSDD